VWVCFWLYLTPFILFSYRNLLLSSADGTVVKIKDAIFIITRVVIWVFSLPKVIEPIDIP